MLRILELIHDRDFPEQPTNVDLWVKKQREAVTRRYFCYRGEPFPALSEFDLLVIHGGDQHLWNKKKDPWLRAEVDFVKTVVDEEKPVIGFCLGSQLLAEVCGCEVFPHEPGEFGFFKITPWKHSLDHPVLTGLTEGFITFEWHSDHFRLDDCLTSLGSTPAVPNQIIVSSKYPVVGFQFHPEFTIEMIKGFVALEKSMRWRTKDGKYLSTDGFLNYLETAGDTYGLFERLFTNVFSYLRKRYPDTAASLCLS